MSDVVRKTRKMNRLTRIAYVEALMAAVLIVYLTIWFLVEAGNPDYKPGYVYDRDNPAADVHMPCPETGKPPNLWCGCLPPVYGDDC